MQSIESTHTDTSATVCLLLNYTSYTQAIGATRTDTPPTVCHLVHRPLHCQEVKGLPVAQVGPPLRQLQHFRFADAHPATPTATSTIT